MVLRFMIISFVFGVDSLRFDFPESFHLA